MAEPISQKERRPYLDVRAAHAVKQFAEIEGRNLSNATSELIGRGWDSYLEQQHTKFMPKVPAENPDAPRMAACYFLQSDLVAMLGKLSISENRSKSAMITLLVREALAARAAASKAESAA